jgi:hypothetical protein
LEYCKKWSTEQLAKKTSRSDADVKESVRLINLATEFLVFIGKPRYYHFLRDELNLTQAFKTLSVEMKKLKTVKQRDDLKKISFAIMRDPAKATKGTGKSVHNVITLAAKNLHRHRDDFGFGGRPEKPPGDDDGLFAPKRGDSEPVVPTESAEDEDEVSLDEGNEADVVQRIIDVDIIVTGERMAKNEKVYAKRQIGSAITSFENILLGWERQNKRGLKRDIKKAIHLLDEMLKKLGDKS